MTESFTLQLLAQAAQPSGGGMALFLNTILPFLLVGVVFWFLFIRPQRKEQQKLQAFRAALKVGDEVITNQGIYGKIVSIEEATVQLEIARNTKIKILKQEIRIYANTFDKVEAAIEAVEADNEKEEKATKKD